MKARKSRMDMKRGKAIYENCGVDEDLFPCLGKCCSREGSVFKDSYTIVCPYCRISTSLPYGSSLITATIFECARLGYGRRRTE